MRAATFVARRLNGIATTESHPGAVTILTPLGNKITANLTAADVDRFAALLVERVKEEK